MKTLKPNPYPLTNMLADSFLKLRFREQYCNACRRNILWKLSYEQWLMIWIRSGKLFFRGKKSQEYCMARKGDKGAYEVGNVEIKTNFENQVENALRKTPARTRARKTMYIPRACIVNGTYYESLSAVAEEYGITHKHVSFRINSTTPAFKEWRAA